MCDVEFIEYGLQLHLFFILWNKIFVQLLHPIVLSQSSFDDLLQNFFLQQPISHHVYTPASFAPRAQFMHIVTLLSYSAVLPGCLLHLVHITGNLLRQVVRPHMHYRWSVAVESGRVVTLLVALLMVVLAKRCDLGNHLLLQRLVVLRYLLLIDIARGWRLVGRDIDDVPIFLCHLDCCDLTSARVSLSWFVSHALFKQSSRSTGHLIIVVLLRRRLPKLVLLHRVLLQDDFLALGDIGLGHLRSSKSSWRFDNLEFFISQKLFGLI